MRTIVVGFVAGALSALIFGEIATMALAALGMPASSPLRLPADLVSGAPAVAIGAVIGGLWGVLGAYLVPRLPAALDGPPGWLALGLAPVCLVNWVVLQPLAGNGYADVLHPAFLLGGVLTAFLWAIGTSLMVGLTQRVFGWQWI